MSGSISELAPTLFYKYIGPIPPDSTLTKVGASLINRQGMLLGLKDAIDIAPGDVKALFELSPIQIPWDEG